MMMFYATMYICAYKQALKQFTGLSWPDIVVLQYLTYFSYPIAYAALYSVLCNECSVLSHTTYSDSLTSLTSSRYLTRVTKGYNAYYTITSEGIQVLALFNACIDKLIKPKVSTHGNGFNPR